MAARVRAPDVDFDFHVEGDAWGEWDRTRILEVVDNLLSNAIKHGSRGQPIDVTVRSDGDDVVLAVHNGGAPIPAELVPVLFDPFRRAARSDHRHGELKSHGLGLYIVREIVVSHGGTIDVSSTSEAGTTFTVRLPRGTRATTSPAPEPARPN